MNNPYIEQLYKNTDLAFYYIERALRKNPNSIIIINDELIINGSKFHYAIDYQYLRELCLINKIDYLEEKNEIKKVL